MRCCFFLQAEDGIRDADVTGVQTCALPISQSAVADVTVQDNDVRADTLPEPETDALLVVNASGGHAIRRNRIVFFYPGGTTHGTDCVGGLPNFSPTGGYDKDTDLASTTESFRWPLATVPSPRPLHPTSPVTQGSNSAHPAPPERDWRGPRARVQPRKRLQGSPARNALEAPRRRLQRHNRENPVIPVPFSY